MSKVKALRRSDPSGLKLYSTLLARAELAAKLGMQYGGERDLYQALGYSKTLTYADYATQYVRQDIAKAVIDRPVDATWHGGFQLEESSESEDTKFEKAWKKMYKDLNLRSKFIRLDRLTGIGSYGVLLLGLSDAKSPEDFAKPVTGVKHELLYVKPFGGMVLSGSAQIIDYEQNTGSPRYGKPLFYQITMVNLETQVTNLLRVHYSRVIHVIDDPLESDIEGTPRLESVFNRLQDLEKIVGASAEMFWRGARPGYAGKVDPDHEIPPGELDALEDQVDEFENNLRRLLILNGIDIQSLNPQVSDPSQHVDVQIQMISAVTGIPKRILTGSERGELASTQDRDNWSDFVESRRGEFAEPAIVRPFADRMIELQILPEPGPEGYTVVWPDIRTPSDKDRADVGVARSNALKNYASVPTAEQYVPPDAFYQYFLGLKPEEIELIQEMKQKALEEETQSSDEFGAQPASPEEAPQGSETTTPEGEAGTVPE